MLKPVRSVATAMIGGLPVVDLAAGVALSAYAFVRVSGEGSLGAAFGVVAMTLPVAWCRRAPVAAAAFLAVGGVLNGVLFGSLVRCGTALPAVFIVAFAVAAQRDRRPAALGLALCVVNVASQAIYDPKLGRPELLLLIPILVGFFALGRVARARSAAVEILGQRTDELRHRREETARLEVLADRARVSSELDAELRERLAGITAAVDSGRTAPETTLPSIERQARDLLRRMRDIVAQPDDAAPSPRAGATAAPVARKRWSLATAITMGLAMLLLGALAQSSLSGAATLLLAVTAVIAYVLGTDTGIAAGIAGVALMSLGLQVIGGSFNPLFEMITLGPWLAGRLVQSRRRLAEQIEMRNRELEAARALYALEEVRYERARIARELHDIVAHCVTVIVVQAAAGQRLPDRAADSLDAVAEAARDANGEIAQLTRWLDGADSDTTPTIEELVHRTAATGLQIRYRCDGDLRKLRPPAADAAYRVVRESLTNAMKHAPGARIQIAAQEGQDASFNVEVTTEAPQRGPSGLEHTGAGRGVPGMEERVAACGGTLTAGPTPDGGWFVRARLPTRQPHEPDRADWPR